MLTADEAGQGSEGCGVNLSLLGTAHQLLLPLFHRTNESIGWVKFVVKMTEVMGKPDLGKINSLPIKDNGAVRKNENCPSPSQAQLHPLSPGFHLLLPKRHRVNLVARVVTLQAKRII